MLPQAEAAARALFLAAKGERLLPPRLPFFALLLQHRMRAVGGSLPLVPCPELLLLAQSGSQRLLAGAAQCGSGNQKPERSPPTRLCYCNKMKPAEHEEFGGL